MSEDNDKKGAGVIGRVVVSVLVAGSSIGVAPASLGGPSAEAGSRPLRSGTLVSGVFYVGSASDCRHVADCAAWLRSRCNPALAGRDPAWTASIVNVADLSDGRTPRAFKSRVDPGSVGWGGVAVQFWRKSCSELNYARGAWKRTSARSPAGFYLSGTNSITLKVPSAAKWMTVSTHDTVNIKWTLK